MILSKQQVSSYVINLDHRVDRYDEFVGFCGQFGLNAKADIRRWSAVKDSNFGALGCTKSHVGVLSDFLLHSDKQFCLVFEDDFRLARDFADLLITVNQIEAAVGDFDVFLLGGSYVKAYPSNIQSVFRVIESQSTLGYLVSRRYVPALLSVFSGSIPIMERFRNVQNRLHVVGPLAADQVWKTLQRRDKWFISRPSFGYQNESYSDIELKKVNYRNVSW